MMDPRWKLSTSQPSRGVAIQYESLSDEYIERIPVAKLQKGGIMLI
jgi:mRNA (2'-O-methyladenosine-N6-)-methyltransferase